MTIVRLSLTFALLLAAGANAFAQSAISHQTLALAAGQAGGLDAGVTKVNGTTTVSACRVTVEGSPMRYWTDGTTPTATSGHLVNAGAEFSLGSYPEASQFKATPTDGPSTLQVTCLLGTVAAPPPTFDAGLLTPNSRNAVLLGQLIAGLDATNTVRALAVTAQGLAAVQTSPASTLPLPLCNAVLRYNCR